MIDPSHKADTRQIQFSPPSSAVAALMQLPAYQMTPEAATRAYMKDWRASRRAALQEKEAGE